MISLLLESPATIVVLGVVGAAATAGGMKLVGRMSLVKPLATVVAITLSLLVMERLVETDREQVEKTLQQMAADVQHNNMPAVLAHIHSSVPAVRTQAELLMPSFVFEKVDINRIRDIRVAGARPLRTAVAEFNVTVVGRDREGSIESGSVPRFVILTLKRENGVWRVVDIEDHDAHEGYLRRVS